MTTDSYKVSVSSTVIVLHDYHENTIYKAMPVNQSKW